MNLQSPERLRERSNLSRLQGASPSGSLRYLKGIGPKRALALEKLGITTVRQLLYFFPRRYEDRSQFRKISDLKPGETATLRGEILKTTLRRIPGMIILEVLTGDETGVVTSVWFNQPYLKNQFLPGSKVILYGKVELYKNRFQLTSPEYEFLDETELSVHTGRITPIYPLTAGLYQRSLRNTLLETVQNHLTGNITETLPSGFLSSKHLISLRDAIREMHFPESFQSLERARRRLAYDEFLIFELALIQKIEKMRSSCHAPVLKLNSELTEKFIASLPFTLTQSQLQAIDSLSSELSHPAPMNRLLQGDVGSGKTIVAAFALLLAGSNGKQGVILVPTEILAEQHARTLHSLLSPFNIQVSMLTSSIAAAKRERLIAELKQGKIQVLVGTQAVLQEDVYFHSLALVIIDEQHKFGVHQRCQLFQREPRPHQLVMTATPIPRTLALTLYADFETSLMTDRPASRQPVETIWARRKDQIKILELIREKVTAGEQAYFIFPAVEETEKSDLLAATQEYEKLRKGPFLKLKMGLVHGRMSREERNPVMKSFREGSIQILVATSVIEVGVDNPNASIMVIENADHFGLAQLHQMRGRIGRGSRASICFLFGEPKTEESQSRLQLMTRCQDGFQIAEEDLKLRGPGDFWGTRQSGEPVFRVAHPVRDQELLLDARSEAKKILASPVFHNSGEWDALKKNLEEFRLRY